MTAGFKFSDRSLNVLETVDPRLRECAHMALLYSEVDFGCVSGLRTKEEQQRLVLAGASKTMHSKHLTGHAVDIMAWLDGRPCWEPAIYMLINPAWEKAADELGFKLTWGGTWGWDFGHYEIEIEGGAQVS